ncbi:hypothetical protein F383_32518 [Gossypium arboreum]|uniref:Uncharacterized protein n=1 Tax=Gossypium arboreum TaxID=29729 RepID=A0A0B0PGL2_GOSAR|nr:hypothetical protein F383_30252 [Gossypium arboreum]KHG25588.1 hypothetical protein F383_32518 [Gossypium arboreum]
MCNSDLSEMSELTSLFKTQKKKQSKLYSLVSSYNSKLNLPFIHNQSNIKNANNSIKYHLITSILHMLVILQIHLTIP